MGDQSRIFASAFLCEKVLSEGRVHSAIRIVDTLTVQMGPEKSPEGKKITTVANYELTLFVILKSEEPVGGDLWVSLESPNGKTGDPKGPFRAEVPSPPSGSTLRVTVKLNAAQLPEGLYWFNVLFGETIIQRCPMKIIKQKQPQPLALDSAQKSPGPTEGNDPANHPADKS
jgi:hypothetical protein